MEKKKFIDFLPESFKAEYLRHKKAFSEILAAAPAVPATPAVKEGKLKDGTVIKWDTDTLAVGSMMTVVSPEGELPAPNATHEMEDGRMVTTVDGKVTEIKMPEMMNTPATPAAPTVLADYPWEQCIADQMKQYNDMAIAEKVCGAIKGGSIGMKEHVKAMSDIVDLQIKLSKQEKENQELKKNFEAQSAEVKSTKETVTQLFEMMGKIMELPTEEPVQKPENKQSKLAQKLDKYINRK